MIIAALALFFLLSFIFYCAAACKTKEEQEISDQQQIEYLRRHSEKKSRNSKAPGKS